MKRILLFIFLITSCTSELVQAEPVESVTTPSNNLELELVGCWVTQGVFFLYTPDSQVVPESSLNLIKGCRCIWNIKGIEMIPTLPIPQEVCDKYNEHFQQQLKQEEALQEKQEQE